MYACWSSGESFKYHSVRPSQVLQHTALHAIHLIGQEALRGNAEVEADNFQRIKTYGGALSFDGIDGRLCDADLFGKRGL